MADLPAVIPPKSRYTFPYLVAASVAGIALGILITWAFFTSRATEHVADQQIPDISFNTSSSTSAALKGDMPLSVQDQAAGMSVVIARAAIGEGQWIVVHEDRDGALGNVLGAARFIGETSSGTVELLRGTRAGATYYAVIYADNGDRQFSLESDTPLRDASGTLKSVTFKAQ